jgi:hypothetical protein
MSQANDGNRVVTQGLPIVRPFQQQVPYLPALLLKVDTDLNSTVAGLFIHLLSNTFASAPGFGRNT